jgi:hypothetical protein
LTHVNGQGSSVADNASVALPPSRLARPAIANMNSIRAIVLSALCVLVPGHALAVESLAQALAKMANVYGPAPGAIRESGTAFSALEGEGTLLRLYKFPDRFHIEIAYAMASDDRTMVGTSTWNKKAPATPMARGAIVLQAARIALPWSLLARQSAALDRGAASLPDGRTVRVVEFPLGDALSMLVDIDPDSGYILRTRGMYLVGGNAIEFATLFSDFRKEGGRVHAAREEQYAAGTKTGYSFIDKVEYPDSLPDAEFAPWATADGSQLQLVAAQRRY